MITVSQIRAARGYLKWSVATLAEKSGISKATVIRMEKGLTVHRATQKVVQQALETAGIIFDGSDSIKW